MHRIAASILSADRRRLPDELRQLVTAGIDAVHMNVLDADERPNLDLGHLTCAAMRDGCPLPLHVHLRVPAGVALIDRFAEAGADLQILQWSRSQDTAALLARVRAAGCQVGLAFGPGDPVDGLPAWLEMLDLVHVSCAMPAMVNRNFQQAGLVQLARARALIDAAGSRARLQADGDISLANVGAVAASGVDDIVVGRALFGSSDRAAAVQALRDALAAARAAATGQVPA